MGGVEKTTIYLTTEQKAALASAAHAQGRSEAHLIREGIAGVLSGQAPAGDSASQDQPARPRWLSREAFVRQVVAAQADSALAAELRVLAPDLTDELPDR